jgi:hypothetical protein
MSILASHAASWHNDRWYRRAWYIWPQVASLLVVGWVFAGVLLKPVPWAEPRKPPPKPAERYTCEQGYTPGCPQPNTDVTICSRGSSPDALAACGRLIDKGLVGTILTVPKFILGTGPTIGQLRIFQLSFA